MEREYFNFSASTRSLAEGYWTRRDFIHSWWRIYADDNRWTPPDYARLMRALEPERWPYIARQRSILICLNAMARRRRQSRSTDDTTDRMMVGGSLMEQPVCATLALADPARRERTGLLALLHCRNDVEVLERFLWLLMEQGGALGVRRFIGPTGISPLLQSGVLQSHFSDSPPLHTPYNPPYLPEILESAMEEIGTSHLYVATVQAGGARSTDTESLTLLDPTQLESELAPLIAEVYADGTLIPAPDPAEAAFLIDWISAWPMEAWLLRQSGQAAGFVILQADWGRLTRRSGGGRNPAWRLWLDWRKHASSRAGRVVLGGVRPAYRRQGLGRLLWANVLARANALGWHELSVGPVPDDSPAARFLTDAGAAPRQRYGLYAIGS